MPELRRPILVAAFRGWNDGGQGATLGAGYLAKQWEAEQFAEIEPETFYDFQATRPQVTLEDGDDAQARVAGEQLLPLRDSRSRSRCGDPARHRAESALEVVLRARTRSRTRPRCRARGHVRLAARRRPAHKAGAGDGGCHRSGVDGGARARAVPLRRPHGHRRRSARRVSQRRHLVAQPLGRSSPLRLARAEPTRCACTRTPVRRAAAGRRRRHGARAGG